MRAMVEAMAGTYTGVAYSLTVLSGLLTITVERYLYRRRAYKREAKVTAIIGWTYLVGGTILFLLISILDALL